MHHEYFCSKEMTLIGATFKSDIIVKRRRCGILFATELNSIHLSTDPDLCTFLPLVPFLLYRHDLLIKISPMPLHVETLPSPPDSILFTSEAVLVQCKPPLMLDRENVQACTIRTACGRGRVFSSLLISPGVCAKCQLPTDPPPS